MAKDKKTIRQCRAADTAGTWMENHPVSIFWSKDIEEDAVLKTAKIHKRHKAESGASGELGVMACMM